MPAGRVPSGFFLVAEEDKQVGRVISMFLKTLGYSAQEFRNGADAVAAFEAAPEAFACAIIDVGMKKCNGIETLGLLRKLNAKLPAILVSGSHLPTGATVEAEFLLKPFSMKQLSTAIRRCFGDTRKARKSPIEVAERKGRQRQPSSASKS